MLNLGGFTQKKNSSVSFKTYLMMRWRAAIQDHVDQEDPHQAAILLPSLGKARPGLLSGHQDLHLLKAGMVPQLRLEGQLVLGRRFTWTYITPG